MTEDDKKKEYFTEVGNPKSPSFVPKSPGAVGTEEAHPFNFEANKPPKSSNWETFKAAFKEEADIVAIQKQYERATIQQKMNEDRLLNPFDASKEFMGDIPEDYQGALFITHSKTEFDYTKKRILQELNDQKIIENGSGISAFVGRVAGATVGSLTSWLLPVFGIQKFASIGKGTAQALMKTWPSVIAQDASRNFLRYTQSYTREGEDFARDTLIDSAFSGLIVGGAGALAGRKIRSAKKIYEKVASDAVEIVEDIKPDGTFTLKATAMEGVVDPLDTAAKAAQDKAVKAAQAFIDYGFSDYAQKSLFVKAIQPWLKQSPIVRAAQSQYGSVREFVGNLASFNTPYAGTLAGKGQESAEAAYKFLVAKSTQVGREATTIYWEYIQRNMGELSKKLPLDKVRASFSKDIKPDVFFEEVGKAISNANVSYTLSEGPLREAVEKAATLVSAHYDFLVDEMVRVSLFPNVPHLVKGAKAYLNRVYDVNKIIQDPEGFKAVLREGLLELNAGIAPLRQTYDLLGTAIRNKKEFIKLNKKYSILDTEPLPVGTEGPQNIASGNPLERLGEMGKFDSERVSQIQQLLESFGTGAERPQASPLKSAQAELKELQRLRKEEAAKIDALIEVGKIPLEYLTHQPLFSAVEKAELEGLRKPIADTEKALSELINKKKIRKKERALEARKKYVAAKKTIRAELKELDKELSRRNATAKLEAREAGKYEAETFQKVIDNEKAVATGRHKEQIEARIKERNQKVDALKEKYKKEVDGITDDTKLEAKNIRERFKEKADAIREYGKSEEAKLIRQEIGAPDNTSARLKENKKALQAALKELYSKEKTLLKENKAELNDEWAKEDKILNDFFKKSRRALRKNKEGLTKDRAQLEKMSKQELEASLERSREALDKTRKEAVAAKKKRLEGVEEASTQEEKHALEKEKLDIAEHQAKLDALYNKLEADFLAGKIDKRYVRQVVLKNGKRPKYPVKFRDPEKKPFLRKVLPDLPLTEHTKGMTTVDSLVLKYFNKITEQTPEQQLSQMGNFLKGRGTGIPIKGRVNPVREQLMDRYLVRNSLQLLEMHSNWVSKHVAYEDMWNRLGTNSKEGMLQLLQRTEREYEAQKRGVTDKKTLDKLYKEYHKAIDLIGSADAVFWGEFVPVGGRFSSGKKIASGLRIAKMYNTMRMLGNLFLLQGPEYFANAMQHGPWKTIETPIRNLLSKSRWSLSKKQADWAAVALNKYTNRLVDHMYGYSDAAVNLKPGLIEGVVQKGTNISMQASGTNWIGDLLETLSASMSASHSFDTISRIVDGKKVLKRDRQRLAFLNITDEGLIKRIGEQYKKYGERFGEWQDGGASLAIQKAIHREVHSLILKPNMLDIPLFMRNPFVSLMTQFMNYSFGATNAFVLPTLSAPDANKFMGIMMMITASCMVDPLRQISRGEVPDLDPLSILIGGITNSGVLGVMAHQTQLMLSMAFTPWTDALKSDRFSQRAMSSVALGPMASVFDSLQETANMLASGQFNQKGVKSLRNLTPSIFHNWYTTYLTDSLIEGLDLPATQRQATGYFGMTTDRTRRERRQKLRDL